MKTKSNLWMRFPGGKRKTLTLSYDDGVEQDIRLIGIMKKYGLKGTFNLNSGLIAAEGFADSNWRMDISRAKAVYKDSGIEVAVHGLTHPHLEQLTPARCTWEVMTDRDNLEREFGVIVRGMAYPFGTYSDSVVRCLQACGIAYARTVLSTYGFALPSDWYHLAATCRHRDPRLMELAEQFREKAPAREPWMFYLWGHSYEFDIDRNWNVIEEFADYMGGRDDIWYATNLEICDYTEAWKHLVFSADGTRIYNPTAYPLWLGDGNQCVSVQPGEEIEW